MGSVQPKFCRLAGPGRPTRAAAPRGCEYRAPAPLHHGCPRAWPRSGPSPGRGSASALAALAARMSVGVNLERGDLIARVRTAIAVQADQLSVAAQYHDLPALQDNLQGAQLHAGRMKGRIGRAVRQVPGDPIEIPEENPAIAQGIDGRDVGVAQGIEQPGPPNLLAVRAEIDHPVPHAIPVD